MNLIATDFTGYKIEEAETLQAPGKNLVYEVEIAKDGTVWEVQISMDGTLIQKEEKKKKD